MRFRVIEKVLDGFNFEGASHFIYLNPTLKELNSKEDSKWNRGILDPEGNLYMDAQWDAEEGKAYSNVIHFYFIQQLHGMKLFNSMPADGWHAKVKYLDIGLCVQRYADEALFHVAESYLPTMFKKDEVIEKMEEIMEKARAKMPWIQFISQRF